ncbi:MAG: hypothetical protein Crog4KO_22170 [Crocinitomicaceae bacterium]
MKTEKDTLSQHRRSALDYLEDQIDIWNQTAKYKKEVITTWRKRITVFMLIGAALGLASQQVGQITLQGNGILAHVIPEGESILGQFELLGFEIQHILAALSAISVALATFAGSKILSNDLEKAQLKARAAAEALKVQAFLYSMKAPPYSGQSAEKNLFKRIEIILKEVASITPELSTITDSKKSKLAKIIRRIYLGKNAVASEDRWIQRFKEDMTFDEYVEERVNGQIHGYYRVKAAQFQRTINTANAATLVFGFLGIAIGTIGATTNPGLSMWIGLLSTASASIASYIHAGKYEYLLMSYVSTASQLELLSARFQSMTAPSERTRQRFVSETETIFAAEHNSWISEIAGTNEEDEPTLIVPGLTEIKHDNELNQDTADSEKNNPDSEPSKDQAS